MGIYDRHYVRDNGGYSSFGSSGGGRGLAALRGWSVTTWLIVICVGVYVLDNFFLPPQIVPTDKVSESVQNVPREMWTYGNVVHRQTVQSPSGPVTRHVVPIVERSTGQQSGWGEVYVMRFLESYLHFSTQRAFFWPYIEFWRFIGFQFLHANFSHLLFNMIALYFFGPMVEQYLGSKRYLAFYLLCGICGALMYLLLNLSGYIVTLMSHTQVQIPGLLFNDPSTPLVGASAGIFGVLMAGAFLAPHATVLLFFFLPMQLRTLAYVLVGISIFTLLTGGHNAGGEAGHLGGAIAGFYFIRNPHHLHGFFDFLGWADPTSHHYRDRRLRQRATKIRAGGRSAEIDRILDKINEHGIHSLTEQEKRVLREASRQGR